MPLSLSLSLCLCHYVPSLFLCPAIYIPVSQSFSVPLSRLYVSACVTTFCLCFFDLQSISLPLYSVILCAFIPVSVSLPLSLRVSLCFSVSQSFSVPQSLFLCLCPCHYTFVVVSLSRNLYSNLSTQSFSVPLSCLYVSVLVTTFPSLYLCPPISIPTSRFCRSLSLYLCLYVSVRVTTFNLCFFVLQSISLSLSLSLCLYSSISVSIFLFLCFCLCVSYL